MRFSLALILFAACTPKDAAAPCHPVTSWSLPAFRCTAAAPVVAKVEPPPEPAPAPPPEPPTRAKVAEQKIEVSESVEFEVDSAKLRPDSETLLDEVAKVLADHPELTKVQVEGYTDSTSTRDHNQKLSTDRAAAVRTYLIGKGIDKGRLVSKGFGQDSPIADNATDEGRHKNRRVDFKIVERR